MFPFLTAKKVKKNGHWLALKYSDLKDGRKPSGKTNKSLTRANKRKYYRGYSFRREIKTENRYHTTD